MVVVKWGRYPCVEMIERCWDANVGAGNLEVFLCPIEGERDSSTELVRDGQPINGLGKTQGVDWGSLGGGINGTYVWNRR